MERKLSDLFEQSFIELIENGKAAIVCGAFFRNTGFGVEGFI